MTASDMLDIVAKEKGDQLTGALIFMEFVKTLRFAHFSTDPLAKLTAPYVFKETKMKNLMFWGKLKL